MLGLKNTLQSGVARLSHALDRQRRYHRHKKLIRDGLLSIGEHTYGIPEIHMFGGSVRPVRIGRYCSISPGVTLVTGGIHPTDWVSTYPFRIRWNLPGAYEDGMPTSHGAISIGSDVWLGTDVLVLSGVTIGDGAIVAARSVVTKDVPPFAIMAGVPARLIRYRFEAEVVEELLGIRWWEWDEGRVRGAVHLLSSSRIEEFLKEHGGRE